MDEPAAEEEAVSGSGTWTICRGGKSRKFLRYVELSRVM